VMINRAMAQRAEEIGAAGLEGRRAGWVKIGMGVFLGMAVCAYLVQWRILADAPENDLGWISAWGYLLAVVVAIYGAAWLGQGRSDERKPPVVHLLACLLGVALMISAWFILTTWFSTWGMATRTLGCFNLALGVALFLDGRNWLRARLAPAKAAAAEARPVFSRPLAGAPVYLSVGLALAVFGGVGLHLEEWHAVQQVQSPGSGYGFYEEMNTPRWQALRGKYVALLSQDPLSKLMSAK